MSEGGRVLYVEGCKDVDTATEKLGVAATTAGGVNDWRPEFAQHFIGAIVAIIPDQDEAGRKHAERVAADLWRVAEEVRIVDLPRKRGVEGEDLTDFFEAGGTKEDVLAAIEAVPEYEPPEADRGWPKPRPLPTGLPAVQPLDREMVPAALRDSLRDWVFDSARQLDDAPPDFIAAAAVVVASSVVGRKVVIRSKARGDWEVVPNLWGALVGRPATMKTPALLTVTRIARSLVEEVEREHQQAYDTYERDQRVLEARRKGLEKKLDKFAAQLADGKPGVHESDLTEVSGELERLKEQIKSNAAPVRKRFKTNDTTIEALAKVLASNPNGILQVRDELAGSLGDLDRPGYEGRARPFYLEAWSGDGDFDLDRVDDERERHVSGLCLSILGGIQPGKLERYVIDALDEGANADGFIQRFQGILWPDVPLYRRVDEDPNEKARTRAWGTFRNLAKLDPEEFGAKSDGDGPPFVRFTTEAQEVFDEWRDTFEPQFRRGEYAPAIEAHFTKYRSLLPSLALLFELIDFCDPQRKLEAARRNEEPKPPGVVSRASALRAAAFCAYLQTHALRVYHHATTARQKAARMLLGRIEAGAVKHGMPVADVVHKGWSMLGSKEQVQVAADVLAEHGWVRRVEVRNAGSKGGRPSEQLYLHPELRARG